MKQDELPDMDAIAIAAAGVTGIKKQFTDLGWTDRGAEEITVAIFNQNAGKQ